MTPITPLEEKEAVQVVPSTAEIQAAHLDDGWRILAVCPPNAQRRPDYILGRRKDEF